MIPEQVLSAWGWARAELAPIAGGLINQTFVVREAGAPIAVLQRLHPVFGPKVNLDIEAVTERIAKREITPRLIRTLDGRLWVEHEQATWRALTWVEGETVHRVPDRTWAFEAGRLVGLFHLSVSRIEHEYAFVRAGVHDTPAHLEKLAACLGEPGAFPEHAEAATLASEILAAARELPELPETPRRNCHGDLKISNILFKRKPKLRAVCLLDLDTLGKSTIAYELGDAMRSWCNRRGEDAGSAKFELPIFRAAMDGYRRYTDGLISDEERRSVVYGLETVCVELAARFCVDVFRDSYFGWDQARFPSRRAHNLVRARSQLALALDVRGVRADALEAAE